MELIKLEQSAINKIVDLYIDENDQNISGLRIFVQGGGCSGFQYGFTWDSKTNDDDYIITVDDKVNVLVDAYSAEYLRGSTVSYKKQMMSEQFVIENPNATTKCGCGSSFSA